MSKPIGMTGLARITGDTPSPRNVVFLLATAATLFLYLDPTRRYKVFAVGAGPSDVTVAATQDSLESVENGTAKYAALKTYTAMAAAGGYLGPVSGTSALKVTHVKNGAGVDDAPTVAALGGRFQLRAVDVGAATDAEDSTSGLGDYTPLTAT